MVSSKVPSKSSKQDSPPTRRRPAAPKATKAVQAPVAKKTEVPVSEQAEQTQSSPAQKERDLARRELEKTMEHLPDSFVDCRDFKHSWVRLQDYRPKELHAEGGAPGQPNRQRARVSPLIYRQLICTRCGCVRTDTVFLRTFEKLATSYAYPENYQIPGVPRGVRPATVVRQEQYRRALEKAAHAEPGQSETMTSAAEK